MAIKVDTSFSLSLACPRKIIGLGIAKNEEPNISEWVTNLFFICSDVILIDTGSTDSTVSLARSLGATVWQYPDDGGVFDYAKARNFALTFVPLDADWIVFTDIDEIFDIRSLQVIAAMFKHNETYKEICKFDAIGLALLNISDDGSMKTVSRQVNPRIIRANNEWSFSGMLHEVLLKDNGKSQITMAFTDPEIQLTHKGYKMSEIVRKDKGNVRAAIVEHFIKYNSNPDKDIKFKEWLAGCYDLSGRIDDAIKIRKSIIPKIVESGAADKELAIRVFRNIMVSMMAIGTDRKSDDLFFSYYAVANYLMPYCPDFDYLMGLYCEMFEMWFATKAFFATSIMKLKSNPYGETCANKKLMEYKMDQIEKKLKGDSHENADV